MTAAMDGYTFQRVDGGVPNGQSSITIAVDADNVATNQSLQFLANKTVLLHDWNGDGIVSIVGDVPPFVNCVYFSNCPDGVDVVAIGDGNGDGIVSIVGDVPSFVDCVYFGNCPD